LGIAELNVQREVLHARLGRPVEWFAVPAVARQLEPEGFKLQVDRAGKPRAYFRRDQSAGAARER
jgi:hypothetical protein